MLPARPEPTTETDAHRTFRPDAELSEQLAEMTERALSRVAADSAVQHAQSQIASLQQAVEQLRAEGQWREAGWTEERQEMQARLHAAQLETTAHRTQLDQAKLDIHELDDEVRCARGALEEARTENATLSERNTALNEQLQHATEALQDLRAQLLERERLLGAMWQTLQEYRAQGPLHRFLRPPGMPDEAPRLIGVVDAESGE